VNRAQARGRATLVLVMARMVVGVTLTIIGLLAVTDRLSLRELLAETGPDTARQLVLGLHAAIEHSGAQAAELTGALIGMALIALSIRSLLRTAR